MNLLYDPRHFFLITLDCEHSWKARHGQKSYGSKIVWQKEGLAHAEASIKGTRLSFRFDVPDNLPFSSPESFDYHTWHVQLTARLPGADLHRGFEIPVFPTGKLANNIRYNSTEHPDYPKFRLAEALSTFKVSTTDDGEVFLKYAMFYRKKLTAGLILLSIGLGCGLPGIAILLDELNGVGMAFSLVGLVFFLIGFYVLFHHLAVRLNSEGLQTTVKILGIAIRRKNVSRDDIKYLGLIMGNWITAYTKNGRPMTISTTFSDPGTAQRALEAICKLTGLSAQKKK